MAEASLKVISASRSLPLSGLLEMMASKVWATASSSGMSRIPDGEHTEIEGLFLGRCIAFTAPAGKPDVYKKSEQYDLWLLRLSVLNGVCLHDQ